MHVFLIFIFLLSGNLVAQEATDFYLIKEKEIALKDQISSIFLDLSYGDKKNIETILKMNKVKNFEQLKTKLKIWIPSPLTQKKCNYVRTQSGLVSYKKQVSSEEKRIEIIKKYKNKCNFYDVHLNYIRRTGKTSISTIAYSLFLKNIWKPKGVMSQIKRINGLSSNEEFKTRSVFMIPPIAYANGCNYMKFPSGKIQPLVLVNKKLEREELAVAFKCVGARDFPKKENTEPQEEPKPKVAAPVIKKHFLSILAATTYHYDQSEVSDVEVEIISGYALVTKYHYELTKQKRINFYGILENYLEVKNRELGNNLLWRKTLNYEKLFSEKLGYTLGLYEDWYFDNIEVDKFYFTSSLMPYAGLTYYDTFKDSFKLSSELGIVPPLDIIGKDRFKYGVFFKSFLNFPVSSWDVIVGSSIDYTGYTNHVSQNISFQAGLSFSF